jgi:hypothetical protein
VSENRPQRSRIDDLLAQDPAVSSFQFEEFRVNLEASIRRLEQRARAIRRASLCGLGLIIACIVSVVPLEMLGPEKAWVPRLVFGFGVFVMFVTGVLTWLYQYRYQPALGRLRGDLQSTMFAQIQQQIAELNQKLESR